ncbi:MAG: hypothetical protein DJ555_04105 [Desulfurococcaceae archaeon]|nr:MAG: hypothetical protein DJ555_04105 [Desulfurococcaceae archaeon]
MEIMARLVLASIAMIIILILGVWDIAIPTIQAYDPPSIFNRGSGGYSEVYSILRSLGYSVSSIDDLRALESYSPGSWVLVMASPDEELSQRDLLILLGWFSRGGRVIALDEVGTLSPLLGIFNASLTSMVRGTDASRCYVDGREFYVLYNMYSWIYIRPGSDVEVLCTINDIPTAVGMKIHGGELIFISDSSIVINNILGSRFGRNNLNFFLGLLGGKGVLFYEGGRHMVMLRTSYILSALMLIPLLFSYISDQILSSGVPGIFALLLTSILITVIMITVMQISGIPVRSGVSGKTSRVSINIDVTGIVVKGVERWRRLRERV